MTETVRYTGTAVGRVQGVGFRMFVREHAKELGLTGWVRNMSDGTVDFDVQGAREPVEKLLSIIRQGNYFIKVVELRLKEENPTLPPERGFNIKY